MNDIEYDVSIASVIPQSVDATLSTRGVAADAKAVGDALMQKANRSELPHETTVNGIESDETGNIVIKASDIQFAATGETLETLSNHGERLQNVERIAEEAYQASELAKTALQKGGDTMEGDLSFVRGNNSVAVSAPTKLESNETVFLPSGSGTIALTGLAPKTYTINSVIVNGYITSGSASLQVQLSMPMDGRRIADITVNGTTKIRSAYDGYITLQPNHSENITADEFNENMEIVVEASNILGCVLNIHRKDGEKWYRSGTTSTTAAANNYPVSIRFSGLNIVVE